MPLYPGPTIRRRESIFSFGKGRRRFKSYNGAQGDTYANLAEPVKGKQETVSEGHPWNSRKRDKIKGDVGGEFSSTKQYVVGAGEDRPKTHLRLRTLALNDPRFWTDNLYDGPVYPADFDITGNRAFPPALSSSNAQLDALGASAIAKCKPTNSVADAATFLGELLKDGLPHLVGSQSWEARTLGPKQAGQEYLNAEFGWLPLVSDVRKLAQAVTHANTVLTQYERDAGKVVRRRYEFPQSKEVISTTKLTSASNSIPAVIKPGGTFESSPPFGDGFRTHTKVQRRWFSGAFTYYIPSGYDSRAHMARTAALADKLFGINLTPEVLWNLAPWSWAVDWFSNTGDVISNLSDWATDGLVMRYGYMMEHTVSSYTYTMSPTGIYRGVPAPPVSFVTETKLRRRATPFGFGINLGSLSLRQNAILVALGLSRGH